VYEDNSFEYIPIPESEGPDGTTESKTYGNTTLSNDSGTLADYIDRIQPRGDVDGWISGPDLRNWPLHHDPNFDALTYGESSSRPDYFNKLDSLNQGDVVAFYTGLRGGDSNTRDRYLIGYFTLSSVINLRRVEQNREKVSFSELSSEGRTRLMESHSENAHAKRYLATGKLKATDSGVVIVDGESPGGLLERAIKIGEHRDAGHHYLSQSFLRKIFPNAQNMSDMDFYLGGRKKAHLFDITADEFIQRMDLE
jgi:hypothetical protein